MSNLGVVDPMRVPAPLAGVPARFRALPQIAQAFIVIAIVDALVRTVGLIEPHARFDVGAVSAVGSYVPRDLWILLPAILLLRRATVAEDMPTLFRGALVAAIVTLVAQPTIVLLSDITAAGEPDLSIFAALDLIRDVAVTIASVLLGLGLGALNPKPPRPVVAGLGNVIGWAVVLGLVAQLIAGIAVDAFRGVEPALNVVSLVGTIAAQASLAYFLRAVVRGMDDPSRAERATRTAAAGAALIAVSMVFEAILAILSAALQGNVSGQQTLLDISQWSSMVIGVLDLTGYVLLIAGFAIGLADPLRPMAKDWEAATKPAGV